jgi:hypothetical protein
VQFQRHFNQSIKKAPVKGAITEGGLSHNILLGKYWLPFLWKKMKRAFTALFKEEGFSLLTC